MITNTTNCKVACAELRTAFRAATNVPDTATGWEGDGTGWATIRLRSELIDVLIGLGALHILRTGKRPTMSAMMREVMGHALPKMVPGYVAPEDGNAIVESAEGTRWR